MSSVMSFEFTLSVLLRRERVGKCTLTRKADNFIRIDFSNVCLSLFFTGIYNKYKDVCPFTCIPGLFYNVHSVYLFTVHAQFALIQSLCTRFLLNELFLPNIYQLYYTLFNINSCH